MQRLSAAAAPCRCISWVHATLLMIAEATMYMQRTKSLPCYQDPIAARCSRALQAPAYAQAQASLQGDHSQHAGTGRQPTGVARNCCARGGSQAGHAGPAASRYYSIPRHVLQVSPCGIFIVQSSSRSSDLLTVARSSAASFGARPIVPSLFGAPSSKEKVSALQARSTTSKAPPARNRVTAARVHTHTHTTRAAACTVQVRQGVYETHLSPSLLHHDLPAEHPGDSCIAAIAATVSLV